jgi:hypothetical protein
MKETQLVGSLVWLRVLTWTGLLLVLSWGELLALVSG